MAEMKKISVETLKPGMIFSQAVYIDSENILVGPNVPVSESDIKKIMKWGITEVETMGEATHTPDTEGGIVSVPGSNQVIEKYEKLLGMRKKMIEVHSNACYVIDQIYSSIRKDLSIDFSGVESIVSEIIELLSENSNVFLFLNGLDDVDRNYLVTHSVNVTFYALIIGQAMNYNDKQLKELGVGTGKAPIFNGAARHARRTGDCAGKSRHRKTYCRI